MIVNEKFLIVWQTQDAERGDHYKKQFCLVPANFMNVNLTQWHGDFAPLPKNTSPLQFLRDQMLSLNAEKFSSGKKTVNKHISLFKKI
jgi:hypothetical protein